MEDALRYYICSGITIVILQRLSIGKEILSVIIICITFSLIINDAGLALTFPTCVLVRLVKAFVGHFSNLQNLIIFFLRSRKHWNDNFFTK